MSEISRSIQRFQLEIDEAKVRLPQSESMHFPWGSWSLIQQSWKWSQLWTNETWENFRDLTSESLKTISNSFYNKLKTLCQCPHNHFDHCPDREYNSWDCGSVLPKDVSHSLLAKCLLQGLLSLSQVHQAVVFPEPPFLLLVLLWLDLHSHHQQALDFLNLTSVSLQFVSPSQ